MIVGNGVVCYLPPAHDNWANVVQMCLTIICRLGILMRQDAPTPTGKGMGKGAHLACAQSETVCLVVRRVSEEGWNSFALGEGYLLQPQQVIVHSVAQNRFEHHLCLPIHRLSQKTDAVISLEGERETGTHVRQTDTHVRLIGHAL